MRTTLDKIIGLIKSSKIIQVGIMFILIALSFTILNSEKVSFFGLTVEQEESISLDSLKEKVK